jgi:hypothetical protein
MRIAASLFLLIAIGGCASTSLPVDAIEGGPGQDISVFLAGVDETDMPIDMSGTHGYNVQVEVSNNSNRPVTVTRIVVTPPSLPQAFQIGNYSRGFNEMIDPGQDVTFDLLLQGRVVRDLQSHESRRFEFRLIVTLATGESYFYSFEAPFRDVPRGRRAGR